MHTALFWPFKYVEAAAAFSADHSSILATSNKIEALSIVRKYSHRTAYLQENCEESCILVRANAQAIRPLVHNCVHSGWGVRGRVPDGCFNSCLNSCPIYSNATRVQMPRTQSKCYNDTQHAICTCIWIICMEEECRTQGYLGSGSGAGSLHRQKTARAVPQWASRALHLYPRNVNPAQPDISRDRFVKECLTQRQHPFDPHTTPQVEDLQTSSE